MARLSIIFYVVLLAAAFVLGLVGTIAASQALLSGAARQKPALEKPVELPAKPVNKEERPTVEC